MDNLRILTTSVIALFITSNIYTKTISGFIRDAQTGESLVGAIIQEKNQKIVTSTDNHGYFHLKVITPCLLTISYVGYTPHHLSLMSDSDSSMVNIHLQPSNNLSEITVTAKREITNDVHHFIGKDLSLTPSLGGKPDIIKILQSLPGVQTPSEGMSIMIVRGGDPGQNQYLLDNVPLTYINHFGGLLSVFNSEIINTVNFYKGNFPARHGGKLSSIVEIIQKEGNQYKHCGSMNIGVTDVSCTLEGPLTNKNANYIISARKTMIDPFIALATSISNGDNAITSYGFHDINAKLSWKPKPYDFLYLNIYQGDDYFNVWTKKWEMNTNERSHITQKWGNWLISGRWNKFINSNLHCENILSYNKYRNQLKQNYSYTENNLKSDFESINLSSIKDFSLRTTWKYYIENNWPIEFGSHIGYLHSNPDSYYSSSDKTTQKGDTYNAIESDMYIDTKINLFSRFTIEPSFRTTRFVNSNESFWHFEPRCNLSYKFNSNQNISLNYMKVSQNTHLILAQSNLLKREIWLPASRTLPPEISKQVSASWTDEYINNKFNIETNIYFKEMSNLIKLKEGYENMQEISGFENKIETNGRGTAYGAELSIKKNTGKWTGSIHYAWSKAFRRYKQINNGEKYEYEFNRPHSVNFTLNRTLSKNWTITAFWTLQSGLPFTPALSKYYTINPTTNLPEIEIQYGMRNSLRMETYHRLDLALIHFTKTSRGNNATWTYSIYNAYNHINPFNYYYDNDNIRQNLPIYNQPLELYKFGLFAIIPSISYKVDFDYTKRNGNKKENHWLYYK